MATTPEYRSVWTGTQVDTAVGVANQAMPLSDIVQTTGPNANKVMSQAATTNALNQKVGSETLMSSIASHNNNTQAHPYIQQLVADNTTLINTKPNALNNQSQSQDDCYSAGYVNGNFAPLTFVSNLYATKTGDTTASLTNEKPTVAATNTLVVGNSTNIDYDWTSPEFIFIRMLENPITLSANNSFSFDLAFTIDRNATISWGAKMKISSDGGATWEYISGNQAYGAVFYETGVGNTQSLAIFSNALTQTTEYPTGYLLGIEIYKKQSSATALTTTAYCGVEVDGAEIFSFAQFNFTNISINTNQISDGAVTLPKLETSIQTTINSVAGKQNTMQFMVLPTASVALVDKIYQFVGATTQDYTQGYFYQCVNDAGNYIWQQTEVQPSTDLSGTQAINLYGTTNPTTATVGSVGQLYFNTAQNTIWECFNIVGTVYNWQNITPTIQFTTMPSASAYNGQIVQYVGTSTPSFTRGLFYISLGSSWSNIATMNISSKANKSISADYTLVVGNWSNNQQTLTITGKNATNVATVSASQTGTATVVLANQTALGDANIYQIIDNGTSLTFVCETVPTVDLNILVVVGG